MPVTNSVLTAPADHPLPNCQIGNATDGWSQPMRTLVDGAELGARAPRPGA